MIQQDMSREKEQPCQHTGRRQGAVKNVTQAGPRGVSDFLSSSALFCVCKSELIKCFRIYE